MTWSPILALDGLAENLGGKHGGSPVEEELHPARAAAMEITAVKPMGKNDLLLDAFCHIQAIIAPIQHSLGRPRIQHCTAIDALYMRLAIVRARSSWPPGLSSSQGPESRATSSGKGPSSSWRPGKDRFTALLALGQIPRRIDSGG